MMLATQFSRWVAIANIVACPLAYLFLRRWLNTFAFRTEISAWNFVLAGILALMVALLTVSYQAFRASYANPIDALRYE